MPLKLSQRLQLTGKMLYPLFGVLCGICMVPVGISRFDLWVIKIWNYDTCEKHVVKGILRCRREEVRSVRSIIPTIARFKGSRVVFHTLGISGSIHSAIKKFIYDKH